MAGRYRVTASAPGLAPAQAVVEVEPHQTARVELALAREGTRASN